MTNLLAFWSYVHADDDVDVGRVVQLGRDIVAHYEAITAEEIELFLDRDDLHWGDQWRDKVDGALSNVAFFVPIITPRYFTRPECRREFQFFLTTATNLNIRELILPILYIDVAGLHEDEPSDHLMQSVKAVQWEPWLEYRFKDRTSAEYRGAVDKLARELVRRVQAVERTDVAAAAQDFEKLVSSDQAEEGVLDRLAALEEAMPRWSKTLQDIGREIEEIGNLMVRGTEDIERGDKQGKGFAARLSVARRVAGELDGSVERIEALAQEFVADLNHIDIGVRTVLTQLETEDQDDAEVLKNTCEFLASIRTLSTSAHEGLGSIVGMVNATSDLESMSKDMRSPVRRLRSSLVAMIEAREITDAWLELVGNVNIDCSDVATDEKDVE